MNDLTDTDSRLIMNAGGSNINVYVDNISLEIYENSINVDERKPLLSEQFELKQNYPNPFNTSTKIQFDVPIHSYVSIKIFDILGKEVYTVVDKKLNPGSYQEIWDGKNNSKDSVTSGIYFIKLHAKDFIKAKKIFLVR